MGLINLPYGPVEVFLTFACIFVQLLYDILEPEHIMSCLLSVLHRAEPSDKQWSVTYTNFNISKRIFFVCNQQTIQYVCNSIIHDWPLSSGNHHVCSVIFRLPVLIEVVRLLSDPHLGNGDAELVQSACWRLLPFLVITSPTQSSLAACVARSPVITQHPLTLNWAEGDCSRVYDSRLTSVLASMSLVSVSLFSSKQSSATSNRLQSKL